MHMEEVINIIFIHNCLFYYLIFYGPDRAGTGSRTGRVRVTVRPGSDSRVHGSRVRRVLVSKINPYPEFYPVRRTRRTPGTRAWTGPGGIRVTGGADRVTGLF